MCYLSSKTAQCLQDLSPHVCTWPTEGPLLEGREPSTELDPSRGQSLTVRQGTEPVEALRSRWS